MELLILVIIVHLLILIYNLFIKKLEYLNPITIMFTTWTMSLLSYAYNYEKYEHFSQSIYFIVLSGSLIFYITYKIFYKIFSKYNKLGQKEFVIYEVKFINLTLLVLINLLAAVLGVKKALDIVNIFNINSNMFTTLRYSINYQGFSYGILEYFFLLSFFTTFYINIIINSDKNRMVVNKKLKLLFLISIITSLICAILTTGRTFILLLIIGMIITNYYSKKNKIRILTIVTWFIVFLLVFGFYSIILNKGTGDSNSIFESLINNFTFYWSSGLQGLDYFIVSNTVSSGGFYTFRVILAILNKIGFDVEVVNLVREFTPTKTSTNVYTMYELYIRDFNILGIILIQYFLGVIYAYVYVKLKKAKPSFQMIYIMLVYALIMQPFQDQYFSLLSMYAQIVVINIIFFKTRLFTKYQQSIKS